MWAVFDKDDFPAEHFNEAVDLAGRTGIESGHSNQSFELWYVLHFQCLQSDLHRNRYIEILGNLLPFKYEKNTEKIAEVLELHGSVQNAVKWAKMLEDLHVGKAPADGCPYTRVYILVSRLLRYIEIQYPCAES